MGDRRRQSEAVAGGPLSGLRESHDRNDGQRLLRLPVSKANHSHDHRGGDPGEFQIPLPGREKLVRGRGLIGSGCGKRLARFRGFVGRVRHDASFIMVEQVFACRVRGCQGEA